MRLLGPGARRRHAAHGGLRRRGRGAGRGGGDRHLDRWGCFLLWGAFTGSRLLPGLLHAPGGLHRRGRLRLHRRGAGRGARRRHRARSWCIRSSAEAAGARGAARARASPPTTAPRCRRMRSDAGAGARQRRAEGARVVAVDGTAGGARRRGVATAWGRVALSLARHAVGHARPRAGRWSRSGCPRPRRWRAGSSRSRGAATATSASARTSATRCSGSSRASCSGALVGIPLGYAMGLSGWFRGWFDPIVEFMRPVPPLALIPLVIIWAGIGEGGKIILLFLASLWIMAIAARSGVSGVRLSKVHAAYSLGASRLAGAAPRDRAELAARHLHRRARRDGGLLGHRGRGRAGGGRQGRGDDDHGGLQVPADRRGASWGSS